MALTKVQTEMAGTGSVLQVVQTATTSIFTGTTSSSFTNTGLTVSITPKFANSKILVTIYANINAGGATSYFTIYRNSTNLGNNNGFVENTISAAWLPMSMCYLDSPATTSATSYTAYLRTTTGTAYFGGDGSQTITITAMEIAG